MTQEQDQQAAEKYIDSIFDYLETHNDSDPGLTKMGFLAGCQHVRADALNKAAAIVERKDREISALLQRVATLSNYDAGYQDGMASARAKMEKRISDSRLYTQKIEAQLRAETQVIVVMKDALLTKHEEVVIQLAAERAKAKALVASINKVQSILSLFTSNSSTIFAPLIGAWNINAKSLAENFELQNEYLAKYAEDCGGEGREPRRCIHGVYDQKECYDCNPPEERKP